MAGQSSRETLRKSLAEGSPFRLEITDIGPESVCRRPGDDAGEAKLVEAFFIHLAVPGFFQYENVNG